MGGFNLPLFVLFLIVAIIVAVPLLLWSELPKWAVLLLAPFASFAGLLAMFHILDLIERRRDASVPVQRKAEEKDFILPKKPEGLFCPSCGSEDIALFLYGLPAVTKELKKAIADGKVTLGGCGLYDGAPQWACNACNSKFGELRIGKEK